MMAACKVQSGGSVVRAKGYFSWEMSGQFCVDSKGKRLGPRGMRG